MSTNPDPWCDTGPLPELLEGEPQTIHAQGMDLVVLQTPKGTRVFEGRCPHQGALLGEGEVSEGLLICRNHRWKFDCESGERQGGSPACLKKFETKVENGRLLVKLPSASKKTPPKESSQKVVQPKDLPGPRGIPLLGNARQIDTDRFHLTLEKWAREFGSPYTFTLANHRVVAFTDPKVIAKILRARPDSFTRSTRLREIFTELGVDGVFSAEGDSWRPQRKLAISALSHRNLKGFYPVLEKMADRLCRRWDKVADTGEVIDIQDDLMRFTVDVTTMLAFGHDVNTLEKGDDVIQRHMEKVFPTLARRLQSVVPYWRVLRLPKDRAVDRAVAALREWLTPIVAKTRKRLLEQPELAANPTNFLEKMLSSKDEKGQPFSEECIFGNAMTMLLAGEDTTANTLAWSVHHLLDRPESVSALHDELDEAMGSSRVPQSREIAQGLTLASAIANESMRLRPVAPLLFTDATEPTVVGGIAIDPDKCTIALLIRPSALDDEVMPEGSRFVPERWLDPATAKRAQERMVHIPFGSGPRICPGRSLALLEMNLVLGTLYKNFRIERVGNSSDVTELFSFTVTPENLRVKLFKR